MSTPQNFFSSSGTNKASAQEDARQFHDPTIPPPTVRTPNPYPFWDFGPPGSEERFAMCGIGLIVLGMCVPGAVLLWRFLS